MLVPPVPRVVVAFEVLGPVRALVDGVSVGVAGKRRKALLALLILHHNEVLATDRIAEAIWNGRPPSGGLTTVQSHVSHLRRALGRAATVVVTHPPGYVLSVPPAAVDAYRLEALAARARVVAGAGDHLSALAEFDAALGLWRGDPLADLAGFEFAEREVSRLEEVRLSVIEARLETILVLGRHDSAVSTLEALVGAHPVRERLIGQLMVALYRGGRQADALRVFEEARHRLRDELGLHPGVALQELEGAILRHDSDLQPSRPWRPRIATVTSKLAVPSPALGGPASPKAPPSGTLTFLFTGIEGSSPLWEHAAGAMRAALARHDALLRESIDAHGGFVFSTGGDGFAAAFARASEAVGAAIDAQRALQREFWPQPAQLRVRMGIHTGEAEERDGNYFGDVLNRGSRLMRVARGGEIVLSEVTAAVLGKLPGVELVDLGRQRLRGLTEHLRGFAVQAEGLTWTDRAWSGTDVTGGNLPYWVTTWFGPATIVQRLASDLPARRLVTFTGTGGIGKSRLALEVASRASQAFADGAWIVELGPISDPDAVVIKVASTFCLQPQEGLTPAEAVVDWLGDRKLLLVLDNCEHVLERVVSLVALILARCPHVMVLATSREPLVLAAERVISVPLLSVPDGVDLFCDRAAAVTDAAALSEGDRLVIASICQRLDGIPLAIELAASRARSLSVTEILTRLDDRFRLLTRGRRGDLEHHQTLRATVTWSYQLLSEPERDLFERLSVFPLGFDLSAAESVCSSDTLDSSSIIDLADSLIAKSMLVAERGELGTRYRMLESLRVFAAERSTERGDGTALCRRHLEHFLAVARAANELCLSPSQINGDRTFEHEWDNFRAAHGWAVATGNAVAAEEIVKLTGDHAFRRSHHEHHAWATKSLTLDSTGISSGATAHGWAAQWSFLGGALGQALDLARRGIDVARSPNDPDTTHCWVMVASVHLASGHGASAVTPAAQAMTAASSGSDPFAQAWALSAVIESALSTNRSNVGPAVAQLWELARQAGAPSLLASAAYHEGQKHLNARDDPDPQTASQYFREGLALATSVDDVFMEQLNLYGVVDAATALRAPETARVGLDALTRFYDTRNWVGIWGLLNVLAEWLMSEENAEAASVIYGHLEAHEHRPWDKPVVRQRRLTGLAAMGQHSHGEQWMARGAGLDRDGLVRYVIAQLTIAATRSANRVRVAGQ